MTTASSQASKRIVVGIDGSAQSVGAAAWAMRQAELTGSTIHAVTTWHSPNTFGYPMPIPEGFDLAAEATKVIDGAVGRLRAENPAVEIRTAVEEGHAAQVLVEASKGADLLVVGSRGHGELAGMLLGSVSEHCVAHAHCPVLVFRH